VTPTRTNVASSDPSTTQSAQRLPQGRICTVPATHPEGLPRDAEANRTKPHNIRLEPKLPPFVLPKEHSECLQSLLKFQNAARIRHRHTLERERSLETLEEYRRHILRRFPDYSEITMKGVPRHCRSKIRVALVVFGFEVLSECLQMTAAAVKSANLGDAETSLDGAMSGKGMIAAVDEEIDLEVHDHAGNTQKRDNARPRMKHFPEGWELIFHEAAKADGEYYFGFCLMLAAGMRPCEVKKGVKVTREASGALRLWIKTAKVAREKSCGPREVVVPTDTPWGRALSEALGNRTEDVFSMPSAKKSYDHCVAISKRCLKGLPEPIIPYCFRHRMGALLKSSGWSEADQSKVMGHGSCRTMSKYGTHNLRVTRTGFPIAVSAAREPTPRRAKKRGPAAE
jgi:integrase